MNTYTSLGCSSCGNTLTRIVSTVPARSGKDIRRSRKCPECSAGFVTYEVTAADYALLQAVRKFIKENDPCPK